LGSQSRGLFSQGAKDINFSNKSFRFLKLWFFNRYRIYLRIYMYYIYNIYSVYIYIKSTQIIWGYVFDHWHRFEPKSGVKTERIPTRRLISYCRCLRVRANAHVCIDIRYSYHHDFHIITIITISNVHYYDYQVH
jgi:hypothetical protein